MYTFCFCFRSDLTRLCYIFLRKVLLIFTNGTGNILGLNITGTTRWSVFTELTQIAQLNRELTCVRTAISVPDLSRSFTKILGASVCGVGIGLQRALALDWQMLLNRLPVTIFSNDLPVSQPSLFEICATAIAYTGGLIVVSSLFAIFAAAFETEAVLAAVRASCSHSHAYH